MSERDRNVIKAICRELDILAEITFEKTKDEFLTDEVCSRAVCMTLINIGELIKNLSSEIRATYPHVAWREAAGLRDVAAHKYLSLNMEDVWNTIQLDIPILRSHIYDILIRN